MKQEEIIKGFEQLGVLMTSLGENKDWENFSVGVTESEYLSLQTLINRQVSYNGWFTKENVRGSLLKLGSNLIYSDLLNWASSYTFSNEPRTIAVIMAGNIPLVGFHDFLSVLVSGNKIVAKLSSDDKTLLPALGQHLIEFIPGLKERIVFTSGRIGEIDAVIATGSDNSMQYFEQYFGKYPNIFRKNRTSIAVLKGDETEDDIKSLGSDIFDYFGLGCRNVSYLLLPEGFELSRFFEGVISYGEVIHNNKYGNNYDYNKAVYLMNKLEILDNNFCLLRESNELFSPLSMIHYQFYKDQSDIDNYIKEHESKIQVVVGRDYLDYGQAQCPGFNDYADGVDVMQWLNKL
ncbi:MAG: acyl-CoA reductase [Crocinitomicaceae bacterium]|nr:acyl-CoA reductase [Crocinitomicaceae bacterium]MDC1385467.1 acyl-CoA reductase [Crocinitomicaceae bacterium]